ncbi:MAG: hypothetical protein R3B91_13635 [Planctomycetaceae bacterium]
MATGKLGTAFLTPQAICRSWRCDRRGADVVRDCLFDAFLQLGNDLLRFHLQCRLLTRPVLQQATKACPASRCVVSSLSCFH